MTSIFSAIDSPNTVGVDDSSTYRPGGVVAVPGSDPRPGLSFLFLQIRDASEAASSKDWKGRYDL
jgi:hypothetical protein